MTSSRTRAVLALLTAAVGSGIYASSASADDDGFRNLNSSCCTDPLYGTRANVVIDEISMPSGQWLVHRVDANNFSSTMQAGIIWTPGSTLSGTDGSCGPSAFLRRYARYSNAAAGSSRCKPISNVSEGVAVRAAVARYPGGSGGSFFWRAWVDGNIEFTVGMPFNGASRILAGVTRTATSGTFTGQIGTGSYPWVRFRDINAANPFTIASSLITENPSTRWTVGPLPSPFLVTSP